MISQIEGLAFWFTAFLDSYIFQEKNQPGLEAGFVLYMLIYVFQCHAHNSCWLPYPPVCLIYCSS